MLKSKLFLTILYKGWQIISDITATKSHTILLLMMKFMQDMCNLLICSESTDTDISYKWQSKTTATHVGHSLDEDWHTDIKPTQDILCQ